MTSRNEETIEPTEILNSMSCGGGSSNDDNCYCGTKVVQPDPDRNITYIHCTSRGPVQLQQVSTNNSTHHINTVAISNHQTTTSSTIIKTAAEINATELQLFLGYPFLQRSKNPRIVQFIHLLFTLLLVEYWEQYVYYFINTIIPVHFKRYMIYQLWYIYFPLHQYCFQNRTGIHPNASMEYHALTTSMYWFRYLPNSIRRMRFALHQLTSVQPQSYCCGDRKSVV